MYFIRTIAGVQKQLKTHIDRKMHPPSDIIKIPTNKNQTRKVHPAFSETHNDEL